MNTRPGIKVNRHNATHSSRYKLPHAAKMKVVIVLAALVAAVLAAPPQDSRDAVILRYENDNIGVGGYSFAYETSDGVSRSEQAELRNAGTENEALVVRGTISWTGADGQQYTINFVADEEGFRPEGAHLPH